MSIMHYIRTHRHTKKYYMSSGNILSKIIPNLNFMSKCHCLRLNFKKLMLFFGRGSAFGYIKIYNQ